MNPELNSSKTQNLTPHQINNEFYDTLGDRWYHADDDPVALLRAENQVKLPWITAKINSHFNISKVLRILDVGCGAGFATSFFASLNYDVTGVDLSLGSLETAKKFGPSNVTYVQADARTLPFTSSEFDVVISLDFLEHVENPADVICEISRVLKSNGLFFYHTFSKNWLSYLVVIKGVEWFVKNTPKHMHTYDLFINHKDIVFWCKKNNLTFKEVTGLKPVINRAFFKLLKTKVVPKDFKFETTKSHLISYLGYAEKK